MGQILSNSEVEAILSSLDLTSQSRHGPLPVPSTPSTDVSAYDFERPQPLRQAELNALRLSAVYSIPGIQGQLSKALNSAVTVSFLGVEQSTFRDFLSTAERPGCVFVIEQSAETECCLLDISHSLALTMIELLLGGDASASSLDANPGLFTELEFRLLDRIVRSFLPELAFGVSGRPFKTTRLVSDVTDLSQSESNEATALVSFEVRCRDRQGMMQICVPWQRASVGSDVKAGSTVNFRDTLAANSRKVPLVATARLTTFKLPARDFQRLAMGDVLVTDTSSQEEASLRIDGHEIFRGIPGQSRERRVIRLTVSVRPPRTLADQRRPTRSESSIPGVCSDNL